jgi:hypothetical protein
MAIRRPDGKFFQNDYYCKHKKERKEKIGK